PSPFLREDALVSMPLSPTRCLVMLWDDEVPERLVKAEREQVCALNMHRALFAERYLYADRRDDTVRALGQEHRDRRQRMLVNGGTESFAPITIQRRLKPVTGS